jgi:hypothetical protein
MSATTTERVMLSIDRDLLAAVDAVCDDRDQSRSGFVRQALRQALSNAAVPSPAAGAPVSVGLRGVEAGASPVAEQQALHAAHLKRHLAAKGEQEAAHRQCKEAILKQLEE